MDIYLQEAINHVRNIDDKRNYWFIRTFGGEIFPSFKEKGYVGIGFNDVPYEYIENCKPNEQDLVSDSHFDKLRLYLALNYGFEKGTDTKWARQLINFQHRIKQGDLVIIPSINSREICIGEVISKVIVVKDNSTFFYNGKYEPFPEKRIKIDWKTTKFKEDFNGDLRNLLSSQQAVTQANFYGNLFESHISNLFIKGNNTHLVIQINQDEDINAFHFNNFLTCLTYFYQEFCKDNGFDLDEELYIKIKVQSKGKLALKAISVVGLFGIGGLLVLSNDTNFKLEIRGVGKIEGNSDGLLRSYTDFLNEKQEREQKFILFKESINELKAKNQDSISQYQISEQFEKNGEEDDCKN